MVSFGHTFAGVVQQKGEVKEIRAFQAFEQFGVMIERGGVGVPDPVEFFQADQGVFIGGVTMIKLVLDQAGQTAELGQELAEQADLVHGAQDGGDIAAFLQDLEKGIVDMRIMDEGTIDQVQLVANELSEVRVQAQAALLGIEKDAHQTSRPILEDPGAAGMNLALDEFEAVEELLVGLLAPGTD
jgi:hypothetical protein